MRYFCVVFCGLSTWLACPAQAQVVGESQVIADSTQYEKALDTRRVNSQTDSAGTCAEVLRWGGKAGIVRVFYPSGHLKEYVPYSDLAKGHRHGVVTTWFDNGQVQTVQPYSLGQRTGVLVVYYDNGMLKRETQYVNGNELPGRCFDLDGHLLRTFLMSSSRFILADMLL